MVDFYISRGTFNCLGLVLIFNIIPINKDPARVNSRRF